MANKDLIINNPQLPKKFKALGLLMCTAQEINVKMDRALKPFGISQSQLQILHILSEVPNGILTVNQIKKFMIDESPNLSRALNKLMASKLIIKNRSEEDQRVVYIQITEKGIKLHKEADELLIPAFNLDLPKEDIDKLYEILLKL
jgi:DNA-binding MarR family transcriptional regulator